MPHNAPTIPAPDPYPRTSTNNSPNSTWSNQRLFLLEAGMLGYTDAHPRSESIWDPPEQGLKASLSRRTPRTPFDSQPSAAAGPPLLSGPPPRYTPRTDNGNPDHKPNYTSNGNGNANGTTSKLRLEDTPRQHARSRPLALQFTSTTHQPSVIPVQGRYKPEYAAHPHLPNNANPNPNSHPHAAISSHQQTLDRGRPATRVPRRARTGPSWERASARAEGEVDLEGQRGNRRRE